MSRRWHCKPTAIEAARYVCVSEHQYCPLVEHHCSALLHYRPSVLRIGSSRISINEIPVCCAHHWEVDAGTGVESVKDQNAG